MFSDACENGEKVKGWEEKMGLLVAHVSASADAFAVFWRGSQQVVLLFLYDFRQCSCNNLSPFNCQEQKDPC